MTEQSSSSEEFYQMDHASRYLGKLGKHYQKTL